MINSYKMKDNKRNSSIEILRILAMLFIIASHLSVHGGFNKAELIKNSFLNGYILQITVLGNIGINIFMCIFGYFNIESGGVALCKRIIRIVIQVWFYSISIFLLLVCTGSIEFSILGLIKSVFPISFDEYGFPTVYIIVAMISPFINRGMKGLEPKQQKIFLLIIVLIWCVIPSITIGAVSYYNSTLTQYLLLYVIGAFLRINCKYGHLNKKTGAFFTIFSSLGLLLSTLFCDIVLNGDSAILSSMFSRYSVFSVLLSVGLLIIAINAEVRTNQIINAIASCTFGIYLIHDNNYLRSIIGSALNLNRYSYSPLFGLLFLGVVICIFIVSGIIEWLRNCFLGKTIDKVVDVCLETIQKLARSIPFLKERI